jgi:hypothetical protein
MDIITTPGNTGFLASDLDTYTLKLREILLLGEKDALYVMERGREFVRSKFSENHFATEFIKSVDKLSQRLKNVSDGDDDCSLNKICTIKRCRICRKCSHRSCT